MMKTWIGIVITFLCVSHDCLAQPPKSGWYTNWNSALAEAERTQKPLLVVIRCEQCAEFGKLDAEINRLKAPLDVVANDFILVRLTRIENIDLNLFDFDYDLTWVGLLMNAQQQIYARYGSRSPEDATSNSSVAGLANTMKTVKTWHDQQKKQPPGASKKAFTIRDFQSATKLGRGCLHCHQIAECARKDRQEAGTWQRSDAWIYPPEETVGLTTSIDEGNLIKAVAPKSAAAQAGLQVGDRLTTLGTTAIASSSDIQFALNKMPFAGGKLPATIKRAGKEIEVSLMLPEGWKKTDQTWRPSMLNLLPNLHATGTELSADDRKLLKIPSEVAAFRQDKFVHSTLRSAGILKDDIYLGINGKTVAGTKEDFLKAVRSQFLVGEKITLTIIRDGEEQNLEITLK
ncbi:MAG: Trx7/PDZ domain-containing (seleno)protein [Zavarzinella sp.]